MQFLHHKYLNKLTVKPFTSNDSVAVLNQKEMQLIKKEYYFALFYASLLGFLGVLFYYVPIYFVPFLSHTKTIHVFEKTLQVPISDTVFCIVLTVLEIYLLTLVHLKMVHNIAVIVGHTTSENKKTQLHQLEKIAVAKKDTSIKKFGLDPFQNSNKTLLFFLNFIAKLKGFFANKLLRYLLKRFAGRFAVKYTLDFVAAPVYMFLNALVTYQIYQNTKAELFGQQLVMQFINAKQKIHLQDNDKKLLYDVLQLIAMSKQDFHANHAVLTKQILQHFEIPIKEKHLFETSFYEDFQLASPRLKKLVTEIIVLGFILDGQISWKEKAKIEELQQKNVLTLSGSEIVVAAKQFINGQEIAILNNFCS